MKRRNSITPTKVILAIIAIGAVYKVGTKVTEPPKGPPAPARTAPPESPAAASAAKQPSQAEMVKQAAVRMKNQQTQMMIAQKKLELEKQLNDGKELPKDDGISPDYFKHVSMGKTGFEENAKQEAKTKRIHDEINKEMAPIVAASKVTQGGVMPPSSTPPSGRPTPAPVSPAPSLPKL